VERRVSSHSRPTIAAMRWRAWSEKWLIIHAVTLEAATLCVTYCPVGLRSKMQVHTWVVLKQFSPTASHDFSTTESRFHPFCGPRERPCLIQESMLIPHSCALPSECQLRPDALSSRSISIRLGRQKYWWHVMESPAMSPDTLPLIEGLQRRTFA
jgi:hypothetical protein